MVRMTAMMAAAITTTISTTIPVEILGSDVAATEKS